MFNSIRIEHCQAIFKEKINGASGKWFGGGYMVSYFFLYVVINPGFHSMLFFRPCLGPVMKQISNPHPSKIKSPIITGLSPYII